MIRERVSVVRPEKNLGFDLVSFNISDRFSLSFAAIAPLTNEVKTRSFCSLEVGYGYNEVSDQRMTIIHV